MNREIAKKFLPLIKAFAEGKEIEFKDSNDNIWSSASTPTWNPLLEYRVRLKHRDFKKGQPILVKFSEDDTEFKLKSYAGEDDYGNALVYSANGAAKIPVVEYKEFNCF